jgi:PAS domain S-box-containing protein
MDDALDLDPERRPPDGWSAPPSFPPVASSVTSGASEQRLAALARIGADWFWETDPDGRFTYFSRGGDQATLDLAGRLGRTRREGAVQDPENLARLDALDDLIARRRPFREVLYRAQFGDEPPLWCSTSGEPIVDPDGTFRGYRGVGRDVNELIETQVALQTKTRVLDAVLAAMPDAIRVLDNDGRTISVNDQFFTLFRFSREELLAAPDELWYTLFTMAQRGEYGPGDSTELARARYSLLQGGEFRYERKLVHGPWMEARGVPVEGIGRLTIYREITERKRAERALLDLNATLERRVEERTAELAESDRFHRATLDSIQTRLAVMDGNGCIVATNAAWRQFAEAGGAAWHTAGDQDSYLAACARVTGPAAEPARAVATAMQEIAVGQRSSFEVEYQMPLPDGERSYLCRVARVGDDLPIRMVVTHDDVTVVRQAEQQARRTQRLEAIGTLAGGIAHDLNNALTPILMGLDLLRAAAPDHADTIEMMLASANYGAEMLKQLLTFARGAEGRRMPLRAQALIEDVERIARGTFPKGIRLRSRVQPDLPLVHGDPTQLHHVLLNLCVNARDAMPNGGTLLLRADAVTVDEAFARKLPGARPGRFVRLRVQDTGVGIGPDDLDRIFDPFFKTRAVDLGTGLGLSTALGIVRTHDGFFQVESVVGGGSTFSCYLPAADATSATPRPQWRRTASPAMGS